MKSHWFFGTIAVTLVLGLRTTHAERPESREPNQLQRVFVFENQAYWFLERTRRFLESAPLVIVDIKQLKNDDSAPRYYLEDIWLTANENPLQWCVSEGEVHTLMDYGLFGFRHWPIDALVPGKDRRHPLGLERRPGGALRPEIHSVQLIELISARYLVPEESGYRREHTNITANPIRRPIHYALMVGDEDLFDLYIAFEGKFSLWRGADEEWEFVKFLPMEINGPFFVDARREKFITARNENWIVIESIDSPQPVERVICPRQESHPLYLIEDLHANTHFFRIGPSLLDAQGETLDTIDLSRPLNDQLREAVTKVVARRQ